MKQRATAIVIAATMVAAGLSVAPAATAAPGDCNRDFTIPTSEPSTSRILDPEETEVGRAAVSASGGDETLNVRLDTADDELEWIVFHKNDDNDCVEYTQGGCDGPNEISTEDQTDTCTLFAPDSGMKHYWVHATNLEEPLLGDQLGYSIWAN